MKANLLHGKILKGLQKLSNLPMNTAQRENLHDVFSNLDSLISSTRAYLSKMEEYKYKCEILAAICEDFVKEEQELNAQV